MTLIIFLFFSFYKAMALPIIPGQGPEVVTHSRELHPFYKYL